jgi:hypothetical protein
MRRLVRSAKAVPIRCSTPRSTPDDTAIASTTISTSTDSATSSSPCSPAISTEQLHRQHPCHDGATAARSSARPPHTAGLTARRTAGPISWPAGTDPASRNRRTRVPTPLEIGRYALVPSHRRTTQRLLSAMLSAVWGRRFVCPFWARPTADHDPHLRMRGVPLRPRVPLHP